MNNFKKVGFSALAGSLAMVSAQAAEVTWSGDSSIAYTFGNSNSSAANAALSDGIANDTGLSVSASGELDNGWTISTSMDTGTNNTVSSSQLTLGIGDLGTVQINGIAGAFTNGLDDKLPTAYEETNDGSEHAMAALDVGSATTSGSLSYKTPAVELAGGSIQAMIDWDPNAGVATAGNGSLVTPSGTSGSGLAMGLIIDTGMGLVLYGAQEETESNHAAALRSNKESVTGQAVITMGALSAGYGEWFVNGGDGSADYSADAYSIAFNVNDSLSVSYGKMEDTKSPGASATSTAIDLSSEITAYNIAYTMGSMAIKIKQTDTDNANFTTAKTAERTELAISFSF
jgi:outer membrane protein OmpU